VKKEVVVVVVPSAVKIKKNSRKFQLGKIIYKSIK
jgi:hypothetical protein